MTLEGLSEPRSCLQRESIDSMRVALYAVSLGLLLAGYWWALNQLAPITVRSGLLAIFGLWMGAWVVGVFVAALPTAFVDQANWAFAVGIVLAGAVNSWIYVRSARRFGRGKRRTNDS